jgi:aspartyl-tRNA(Asn)/glutamyl-tRNA(Gln) amidotransferase subunit C
MVDEALVSRLSELANVEIDTAERTQLAADLGRILGYVEVLAHADLDASPSEPLSFKAEEGRPDQPEPSLDRDAFLAGAPRSDAGGFVVPVFVDEG